jgi:hypothetical protein
LNIFVINLEKRTDRLDHITSQLKDCHWVRMPAYDGRDVSLKQFRSEGWVPDLMWRDPLLKRTMTNTEVGCFISHFRCWEAIVATNQPAIIFEDDIELIQSLDIPRYEDLLRRYELLYLGYREMDSSGVKNNGDLLVPSYPYLLSSYALTPDGARKLINTHIKNTIIPVDEYVPIMLGYNHGNNPNATSVLNHHVKQFEKYDKLSAIAFRDPHVKQLSRSVLGSDIESGIKMSQTTYVITVATDESKARLLTMSANRHGVQLKNIGAGVEWTGGDMTRPGGGQKINLVKAFLAGIDDASTVLFVDGYDVVINDNTATVIERFQDMPADVVIAAEKNCWPSKDMSVLFPESHTEYKYPNSGMYVGKAWALKKLFDANLEDSEDDQLFLQKQFLKQDTLGIKAILDVENYIFQCIAGASADVVVKSNKQLLNTATRCCPCILHGNGGGADKQRFIDLAATLGFDVDQINFLPTGETLKEVGSELLEIDFMDAAECARLIEKAERYGNWESMYGDKFPGQEMRIRSLDINLFEKLEQHFKEQINPVIEKHWWPLQMYGLRDAFIIKYSPETQKSLRCHHDASLVSTITYLNSDYTGGDTYFPRQKFSTAGTDIGKMILWPGQVTHGHEGREVTSGTKYALVIWTARRPGDINY